MVLTCEVLSSFTVFMILERRWSFKRKSNDVTDVIDFPVKQKLKVSISKGF